MNKQDTAKAAAAEAALAYIRPGSIVGVGTGSTVNFFIEQLATLKHDIEGTVASSEATAALLKHHQIPVFDLNGAGEVDLYVDGADEINRHLQMIKGGGGALTREKIVAAVADTVVCIADSSKLVTALGAFPLPLEVIPMARSYVAREIVKLGGDPSWREGVVTDNGNYILDIHHINMDQPIELERRLNQIVGVVTNGLFADRPADLALISDGQDVDTLER